MRSDEKPARDAATDAPAWEPNDDADEIRYSLTALGEAALAEEARRTRGRRFRGFGPCIAVA
jgi:hypothetical protein